MNAFVQIVSQLIEAIPGSVWKEQRFFPFTEIDDPSGRLFDACVFGQYAWGALGILWVEFDGKDDLLTMPFRLARHSEDGDLISLSPWSLREASADSEFFDAWKACMHTKNIIYTEKGAAFKQRASGGRPNLLALRVFSDAKNVCVRVESQEAFKIFRTITSKFQDSLEVEILEYLNQQTQFLNFPNLVSMFEYSSQEIPRTHVAISTKYIRNNGTLWHDFLSRLQHARFPSKSRERSSRESWEYVLKTSEALGRLMGEFHRAMTYARDNPNLLPEPNTGEAKKGWLRHIENKLFERCDQLKRAIAIFPEFEGLVRSLPEVGTSMLERVQKIENLGLRIRIHGRVHLGHILNSQDGLFLFDFGNEPFDEPEYTRLKHSCLKDLAALNLSLRYAWYMTERRSHSPIIEEFIGSDGEDESLAHEITPQPASDVQLSEVENTVIRFFTSALDEDASSTELIPRTPHGFFTLYDLMFLMRSLRECNRDVESGNPRLKTSLRILQDFCVETATRRLL